MLLFSGAYWLAFEIRLFMTLFISKMSIFIFIFSAQFFKIIFCFLGRKMYSKFSMQSFARALREQVCFKSEILFCSILFLQSTFSTKSFKKKVEFSMSLRISFCSPPKFPKELFKRSFKAFISAFIGVLKSWATVAKNRSLSLLFIFCDDLSVILGKISSDIFNPNF